MNTIRAVCKINARGRPEIAYLNPPGSRYPLAFYTREEQHSEGAWSYFDSLRPPKTDKETALCDKLKKHYEAIDPQVPIEWRERLLHNAKKFEEKPAPFWQALDNALKRIATN